MVTKTTQSFIIQVRKSKEHKTVLQKIQFVNEGRHKILIVDDDSEVRKIIARTILWFGYLADEASTGDRAIEMAAENHYEIIFLDIIMPDITGLEVLKKIRYISPLSNIYFMTAYSVDEMIREGLKLGIKSCLTKPFDLDTIIQIVKAEIDKSQ